MIVFPIKIIDIKSNDNVREFRIENNERSLNRIRDFIKKSNFVVIDSTGTEYTIGPDSTTEDVDGHIFDYDVHMSGKYLYDIFGFDVILENGQVENTILFNRFIDTNLLSKLPCNYGEKLYGAKFVAHKVKAGSSEDSLFSDYRMDSPAILSTIAGNDKSNILKSSHNIGMLIQLTNNFERTFNRVQALANTSHIDILGFCKKSAAYLRTSDIESSLVFISEKPMVILSDRFHFSIFTDNSILTGSSMRYLDFDNIKTEELHTLNLFWGLKYITIKNCGNKSFDNVLDISDALGILYCDLRLAVDYDDNIFDKALLCRVLRSTKYLDLIDLQLHNEGRSYDILDKPYTSDEDKLLHLNYDKSRLVHKAVMRINAFYVEQASRNLDIDLEFGPHAKVHANKILAKSINILDAISKNSVQRVKNSDITTNLNITSTVDSRLELKDLNVVTGEFNLTLNKINEVQLSSLHIAADSVCLDLRDVKVIDYFWVDIVQKHYLAPVEKVKIILDSSACKLTEYDFSFHAEVVREIELVDIHTNKTLVISGRNINDYIDNSDEIKAFFGANRCEISSVKMLNAFNIRLSIK